MTVLECLRSLNPYPLGSDALEHIALSCGLTLQEEAVVGSEALNRAKGEVFLWISQAPNIAQSGISYHFTGADREALRARAKALLDPPTEDDDAGRNVYGYQGEDF